MEEIVNSKEFNELKTTMDSLTKKLKSVKKELNENVHEKYNLDQIDNVIEGTDEDVLKKYKIMYDQIAEVILKKDIAIKKGNIFIDEVNKMVEYLNNAINKDDLNSISSIEMKNLNEIKDYGNKLVDKILEKETILFNKQQEELKQLQQQKILEFEEKKNELKGLIFNKYEIEKQKESDNDNDMLNSKEQQQLLNDIEFNVIENSMSKLKEWCGKQKHNIIFDSLIDGDGSDNVLMNKVTNKSHLYFISFDTNNNVFGGYFRKSINVVDSYIEDRKSFVFSLLRNGVMKNLKYLMHNDRSWSFRLYSGSNWLYRFGDGDIGAYKIGEASSYCSQNTYEYYNETKPFVDCGTNPFIIKRIVIMKMS